MRKKVSTQDLVVLVNKLDLPLAEVEERTSMTRQAIWKRMKREGVLDPRSQPGGSTRKNLIRPCAFCGEPVRRYKKRLLQMNQINTFCGQECYMASLEQHPYEEWRRGTRLARAIVAQHFKLERGHIVHHEDGNQRNNDLSNLTVFASHSEHMAHHRGRKVKPLFQGKTLQRGITDRRISNMSDDLPST